MKALVTGAGFIGKHVVEHLLERDHSVSVYDRNSDNRWGLDKRVRSGFARFSGTSATARRFFAAGLS